MKRRSFIQASIFSLIGIGALSFAQWLRYSDKVVALARPKFLSMLCDRNTIRTLGQAYLKLKPEETKKNVLLNDLLAEQQDIAKAESQIAIRIKRDFDTDNIVLVQGWILSVTEARQCAYFSTLNA